MKRTYTIKMFLKFGECKHISDLYYNGTIYMRPIQGFRNIKDGELRGDPYEGVSRIRNYLPSKFEIHEIGFQGNHQGIHLRESHENILGNIYSLYCISSHGWDNPNDFAISQEVLRFGSHCLIIKDNKEFLLRIESKLKHLKLKFSYNFVKYYDEKIVNREISIFEKRQIFESQKEFRFYVKRDSIDPLIFSIGSLADISELHLSKDIVEGLKLQPA